MQIVSCRTDLHDKRLLALTFDDGPERTCTNRILDVFSSHGVRATFFALGSAIAGNEDLLERATAEGHEVGSHFFSHESPVGRSDGFIRAEIERATRAIEEATSSSPRLLRPPFGEEPQRAAALGARSGYTHVVLWSVLAGDWRNPSPAVIQTLVLQLVTPGAIVLLHDGAPPGDSTRRDNTVAAVEALVPELLRREFDLVTVSDLLGASPG
jgi:chitooligosaccharide deacetylase